MIEAKCENIFLHECHEIIISAELKVTLELVDSGILNEINIIRISQFGC
jgi:hypothetical protein